MLLLYFVVTASMEFILVPIASQEDVVKAMRLYEAVAPCSDDVAVKRLLDSMALTDFVVKRIDEIGPFGGPYWHIQAPMRYASARNWVLYIVVPNGHVQSIHVRILDNEKTTPRGAPPDKVFSTHCCTEP